MRLILMLVVATGFTAICHGQIGAAAAGWPQPTQAAPQTDCSAASPAVSSGNPAAPSADPTCQEKLDWRLSQHGSGFWTSAATPAPARVAAPSPPTVLRAPPSQAAADASGCMNYQVMVVISGEPREATVVACPQPDGNWQITQYTPGLPAQTFTVPAPTTSGPSPEEEFGASGPAPAWDWTAPPWFFGFAPAVVVVGPVFHHFHRFDHAFGHGFNRGFAHGFAAGHGFAFARRFGFGHGVAVARGFAVGHGAAVTRGLVAGRSFTAGSMHGFTGAAGSAGRRR